MGGFKATNTDKIIKLLQQYNIVAEPKAFSERVVKKGVTNQFVTVSTSRGGPLLLRLNGKLWDGFSRWDENYNLVLLAKHRVVTYVVFNTPRLGIQLSLSPRKHQPISTMKTIKASLLYQLAQLIRAYHQIKPEFKGEFNLTTTYRRSIGNVTNTGLLKKKAFCEVAQ